MGGHVIKGISDSFRIDRLSAVADAFGAELQRAWRQEPSSLKILPSYLSRPSGQERGQFIAVDFGGSNVRVMAVSLLGQGRFRVDAQVSRPLADAAQGYDLTGAASTGPELFAFVARMVEEVRTEGRGYALGLTFSYPMRQDAVDKARLLEWTKEIKTAETVGRDLKDMLTSALRQRGLNNIMPAAIINDTVAAFMAGAYADPAVCVGSICGTGHNSCYLAPSLTTSAGPMIVNIEAGNFALLAENVYDRRLDSQSLDPGSQRLEKMVSGKYLGELFRLVFLELVDTGLLPSGDKEQDSIRHPYAVGAEVLNWLSLDGPPQRDLAQGWLGEHGFPPYHKKELQVVKTVAHAIINRAIHLIAASFIALIPPEGHTRERRAVALDGSVFLMMPGFADEVQTIINRHRQGLPAVALIPVKNGSNLGAALAAAQAGHPM